MEQSPGVARSWEIWLLVQTEEGKRMGTQGGEAKRSEGRGNSTVKEPRYERSWHNWGTPMWMERGWEGWQESTQQWERICKP